IHLGGPAAIAPGGLPRTDEVAVGWRGRPARGLEGGVEARWRRTADLWTVAERGLLGDQRGRWTATDDLWTSRRALSADPRAWRQALGLGGWGRVQGGPARVAAAGSGGGGERRGGPRRGAFPGGGGRRPVRWTPGWRTRGPRRSPPVRCPTTGDTG